MENETKGENVPEDLLRGACDLSHKEIGVRAYRLVLSIDG